MSCGCGHLIADHKDDLHQCAHCLCCIVHKERPKKRQRRK